MNPKSLRLSVLFLLSPLFIFSQSLTGLWTGSLSNDSSSVRKDQSYEIALTEYRGKVYGYSRSEFIVNDILYYIVKRVKGTIDGDVCEVKDDEIISYNFPTKLDKGVKVVNTFHRISKDSAWVLDGKWKTNQTKNYYSVTGKIALKEEKDLSASKIFPHLEELNLAKDVAFYNERKKETAPVVMRTVEADNVKYATSIKTEQQSTIEKSTTTIAPDTKAVAINTVAVSNSQVIRTSTVPVKTETIGIPVKTESSLATLTPEQETERQKTTIKNQDEVAVKEHVVSYASPDTKKVAVNTVVVSSAPVIRTRTEPKKPEVLAIPAKTNTTTVATIPVTEKKEIKTASVTIAKADIIKPVADPVALTAVVAGRKSEFSQEVNFKSDSLELSLYDNGEIDGDTVSIYLNGNALLLRQGLKASAIKKTIYISPDTEELTLVLFADNLGKFPPNTGLLVVHDGDDVYNIRFSADLQKNAGVVFKRKK